MSLTRKFGWGAVAVVTLAIAVVPDLATWPPPGNSIVLDRVTLASENADAREVDLPLALFPWRGGAANSVRYRATFELTAKPDKDLFLLIPALNRRISLDLNGVGLFDGGSHALWVGPLSVTSALVQLPRQSIVAGRNQLTVDIATGPFAFPTYFSKMYVGEKSDLASDFTLRVFFGDQLKTMALAAHVLLGIGLIFTYLFRPGDPLFAWLATFNIVSIVVAVGMFVGFQPAVQDVLPYFVVLLPVSGVVFVGVAFALINISPPRILYVLVAAVVVALLPLAIIGSIWTKVVSTASSAAIMAASLIVAAGLLVWGAIRRKSVDAHLMLAPIMLLAWFAIRDVYVTATVPQHGLNLLLPYGRPLFLAAMTAVMMRRMGLSLDLLDRANETLNSKLAAREAELAVLARQDRIESARRVREHERQRLTHDLHDGISGHLASIIALSERSGVLPIEQAAREALNDLRLVIYSLDLGDRELPLALANFRERLVPQLQRLGIKLDWSIAELPEVSGVTPGNALAILRILQEAITNAIKHGQAKLITIRAEVAPGNMVAITLENDGSSFVENSRGHGLANMRRRARQLKGGLTIEDFGRGVRLTLLLPRSLPDFEDEAEAQLH